MSSTLIAEEISGMVAPTYNSGAANKKYVDNNFSPSGDISWAKVSGMDDCGEISSPVSGEVMMWEGNDWANKSPAMTYDIANIKMSAQQNINIARFKCPDGKKAYIWQAYAANQAGGSTTDLQIEMLAHSSADMNGTHSVYNTSSETLQIGNPLGVSDESDYIEIRFMYSGGTASGYASGSAMMQVSVY